MITRKSKITYDTPLGIVTSYINNENSLDISPSLEMCTLVLPAHMKISECRIMTWKITAKEDCSNLIAVCEFKPNTEVEGSPDSGQWLEAQTWESENYVLSVGTDDCEFLNFRADQNIIPKRFFTNHINGLGWIECTDTGLKIKVPDLLKGETIELRFSIAWKGRESDNDIISTWNAVEIALH